LRRFEIASSQTPLLAMTDGVARHGVVAAFVLSLRGRAAAVAIS